VPIELKVFYSWQSDLPNRSNRGFIQSALEDAAKDIVADVTSDLEPGIDRDTSGVSGSPDIRNTILAKIESCDVFVADVSIIGTASDRPTCNPNVLVEIGYALRCLGDERIILAENIHYGPIEDLPFDLRGRRVISYSLAPEVTDKATARKDLARTLSSALRAIGAARQRVGTKSRQEELKRLSDLANSFCSDRVAQIGARELPTPLADKPMVALHVMPLDSFKNEREFDTRTLISVTHSKLRPMGLSLRSYSDWSPSHNGVMIIGRGDEIEAPFENSYTEVYRNGVIEAVRAGLIVLNKRNNTATFLQYEQSILQYLRECFQTLSALGCAAPILVRVSLFGLRGARLLHPGDEYETPTARPFRDDTISLPPVRFDDLSEQVGKLLKPTLDRAWEQVGHLSSPYVNDDGSWVGNGARH
jgi:hypothetical protein